jgi:cyanophycin synthetase
MNIFDEHPFKVILDYGHNPAAIEVMCRLVQRLESKGRRICVLAAPGDRRDEDIREMGRLAAGVFDHYICRRDDALRGRESDEVPLLLREALVKHGVDQSSIEVIPEEERAVQAALDRAERDDLLLIFGDTLDRCWKQITRFQPQMAEERPKSVHRPLAPVMWQQESDLGSQLESDESWIRDERGVRLPRQVED